jgi:hypothetical protein
MKQHLRPAVYFLLLTLVCNMVGWTFNKEAVADVWFGEPASVAVADSAPLGAEHAAGDLDSPHSCNHWCHAIGHFMGLPSQSSFVIPDYLGEYSIQPPVVLRPSFPDNLFRPPRSILA